MHCALEPLGPSWLHLVQGRPLQAHRRLWRRSRLVSYRVNDAACRESFIFLTLSKYNKPLPWPAGDTGAGEGLLAYSITGQEKVFEFAGVTVNMLVDTAHVMQEIPVFGS